MDGKLFILRIFSKIETFVILRSKMSIFAVFLGSDKYLHILTLYA